MNNITSCQLVCLQKTHDAIDLPHGEMVVIGRSPQTKITDPRCSRTQLELTANWQQQNVSVKQKGLNPTAVDGKDIGSDCVATMDVDSTLFILSGLFPHKVVFKAGQDLIVGKQSDNVNNRSDEQKVGEGKKKQQSQKVNSSGKVLTSDKKERTKIEESADKKDTASHKTDSTAKSSSSTKQQKTISASKRHSDISDVNKQPVEKKMKLESKSKVNNIRNGEHKSGSSSKHSGSSVSMSPREADNSNVLKPKHIDSSRRDTRDSNDALNPDDDDKHLTSVKEKLTKMKQDAAASEIKNNPKKTEKTSTPGPVASSILKKPSESLLSSGKKAPSVSPVTSDKSFWDNNLHHVVFTSKGVCPSRSIAGFDLDGTIIVTRSGKAFPEDADDWKICMPEIFNKLKDLQRDKFKIVFFTNQLGVARGKTEIEDLMKKIANVVAKLQVPVQVFIATHEGRYRKPMTGMWETLQNHYNGGVSIDLASSFYVGDAAGRQVNWAPKKKKDFSCSDRLFAINIGITFKTPEEFFQGQKPTSLFKMPAFDPRKLSSDAKLLCGDSKLTSDSKEMVLLVGFPASGKSHFATSLLALKGYKVISRDNLGKWQTCVKHAQEALVNSSVVIDNTNLSKEERARYIEIATKAGVQCRCFVFTTTVDHCRHNERFRQMTTKSHGKINEMIFNQIKKKYEEPSMNEGFTEIVNVNFVPRFSSKEEEINYRKFLLEK